MKKLLILATAVAGLTATPAFAADSVQVTATGVVAPLCEINTSATASNVLLNTAASQTLANLTSRCNVPAATVTITAASLTSGATTFQLQRTDSEVAGGVGIPYTLSFNGSQGNTGTFSVAAPLITRSNLLTFALPAAISQLGTAAGTYSDVVTATITPNN